MMTARPSFYRSWSHHILPVLGGMAVLFSLYASSRFSFLLFHNLVEFVIALAIFLIFVIAWYTRHVLDNQYVLFIGMAALPSGSIVLLHALTYEGMQAFPGYGTDLSMQLWVVFRYLSGLTFIAAPFVLNRKLRADLTLALLCIPSVALVITIFLGKFPTCYSEDMGMTAFKSTSEYIVSVLLLVSLGLLYWRRTVFERKVYHLMSFSILASMLATLSYTQHVTVIDMTNVTGHFFELLACYLIFKAVVVTGMVNPSDLLFRNLKLSEEKAHESEERYRSLVELSPDAIAVYRSGAVAYINPAGLALYGAADAEQIMGKSVLDLVPPEYRGAVEERILGSYTRKIGTPLREMKILRLDGRTVDVEAASTPIFYSRKPAVQVVIRDITGRKRAEEVLRRANEELEARIRERTVELRLTIDTLRQEIEERAQVEEERARLASAVESTAEAVVITDARGMIQYVNPAFEKITGYRKEEVLGRDLHMLDSGKHDDEFFRKIREALLQDHGWSGRLINKNKDGTLYYEECTITPIRTQSGDVANYVSVRRDVTEKMRLESIAEAAVTMNNIGYVFSGISHEIGNPVSALLVTLDVLKSNLDTISKEDIAQYVDRSLQQLSKIEYLLNSLRNFGIYETPELQRTRMGPFFDRFLSLVSEDFRRKGIVIMAELAQDAEWAYMDPRALQQVMLNLFTNSADALRDRPDARIDVRVSREREGSVRISVADNGCGMTDGQLANLFKPFYTNKLYGTGLGMVIVKNMLTRMHGSIEVVSRSGEGMTVIMTIPGGGNE
jgi:PAS domain S-box-containing protein